MGKAMMIGIIAGIVVGLILVWVLLKVANKGKSKTEYDERQLIGRGKGYKAGFVSMAITLGVLMLLDIGEIPLPVLKPVEYFIPVFVGLITAVSVFIFTDSYWGLNNDKGRYAIIFVAISAVNFLVPIVNIVFDRFLEDGKAGLSSVNLMCGILFIVIAIELLVKNSLDKKGGDEE